MSDYDYMDTGTPPVEADRTWRPHDIAAVLDGTWTPAVPTVGRRADGIGLFYPGKVHTIASESEAGKTWLALSAAADEINAGNHVVYLDFEDSEGGTVSRLLTFGIDRERVRAGFHYVSPQSPLGAGVNRDDLAHLLTEHRPTLVILDGITEAMTLHGLNPLDNKDAATFGRILPRRIAAYGPAVACLDHVTKAADGRGRYAIGAAHKLNAVDGAAYVLEIRKPFGIGVRGVSTLRIAKDRPGQLRRHALPSASGLHWFGDLVVDSKDETYAEVEITRPHEQDEADWRPTVLMGLVSEYLVKHGPATKTGIRDNVPGKNTTIATAVRHLVEDGFAVEQDRKIELLKPYPPEDES